MKRPLALFLILVLAAALAVPASAVVQQSDEFYVADYAGILSQETEKLIIGYNAVLEQQCSGAQIVFVTVSSFEGMSSDEYALQLMNEWGVGSSTDNNGMLVAYCPGTDKGWLVQGFGIMDAFTNRDAETYMENYFFSDADKGNYDEAAQNLFKRLVRWYENEYNAEILSGGISEAPPQTGFANFSSMVFAILVTMVLLVFVIGGSVKRHRYYHGYHPGGGILPFFVASSIFRSNFRGPRGPRGPGPGPGPGGTGHGRGGFGGFGGGRGGFGGGMGRGGGGFGGGGGGGRR